MEFEPSSALRLRSSVLRSLLFLATVLLLPSFVFAESESDDCATPATRVSPAFSHDPWPIRRYLSLSTSAPSARFYRNNKGEGEKMKRVFRFLKDLLNIMDTRRNANDESACNLHRELDWVSRMEDAAEKRQIIQAKNGVHNSCPSRLDFTKDEDRKDFDSSLGEGVSQMLRDAVLSMKPAVETSSESPFKLGMVNWSRIVPTTDWDLRHLSQQCRLETVSAYRVDGRLYMRVAVTNRPVDDFALDYDRQVFEEWVKDDFEGSLIMTHPRLIPVDSKLDIPGEIEESTTIVEKWSARLLLASHGTMLMEDNPAISEAMRQNAVDIDLAEDAIVISNVAILALPLTMNLIPVAFLAELSTVAMLAYIIFTDVVSTLPFLVKGVELIGAADNERRETVAFYMGNKTFGEIEVWTATCQGEDKFFAIGVSFVAIAVAAIVVGVFLEVFAGIVMRRRRRKEGADAEGPFGRAAFDTTKLSLLGSGTDADGLERRYSIDADDIRDESDTETRPSSNESTTAGEKRWWRWGSQSSPNTTSVLNVKVMPSVDSDVLSVDIIPRGEAYFSDEKKLEGVQEETISFMNRLKIMLRFLRSGDGHGSQGFSVGVGSDGMSSAERAARASGSEGYSYGYDEEEEGQESRRDSSMV